MSWTSRVEYLYGTETSSSPVSGQCVLFSLPQGFYPEESIPDNPKERISWMFAQPAVLELTHNHVSAIFDSTRHALLRRALLHHVAMEDACACQIDWAADLVDVCTCRGQKATPTLKSTMATRIQRGEAIGYTALELNQMTPAWACTRQVFLAHVCRYGHIGLSVPNVEAACERFESLGVPFVKRPNDGKMKGLAFIQDPDGYWWVHYPEAFSNSTGASHPVAYIPLF